MNMIMKCLVTDTDGESHLYGYYFESSDFFENYAVFRKYMKKERKRVNCLKEKN